MNRETTFWSVVTAFALAAILVLYAQDAGLFEREKAPNDTIDVDTSSDEIEESVDEPVDEPVEGSSNETVEGSSNETVDDTPDETSNETSNTNESQASTADSPDPLALDCVEHGELPRHDHVTLQVFIDGSAYTVESDIGIRTDVCTGDDSNSMHTIHTHDDTGKLHVELNDPGDISLGVFFDIWGHHFNETGIFDYRINATHEMVMYVHASGESASEDNRVTSFDDYLLQNSEVIEVHYRAKAN